MGLVSRRLSWVRFNVFIDSHAHIQLSQFDQDRQAVIDRATLAKVETILVVGFDLETSQAAIRLAETGDQIYATVGIHPHEAKDCTSQTLEDIYQMAQHPKVVALGEMGLDYFRNLSPELVQKEVFEQQLDLAEQLNLPVVIHNREAFADILPILQNRCARTRGVLHCFSGNVEAMQQSIDAGFYIGIGGPVTYTKADDLRLVAQRMPADRFLIETDCPWLAPQFRRGKRNESAYVTAVAEKIAELRQTTAVEIGQVSSQNFRRLFL